MQRASPLWLIAAAAAAAALLSCASERSITDVPQTPVPPPAPVEHAGFFVSPNGSSSADGSRDSPWNLATALSGAGGRVRPGDTVWVRAGTYYAPFRSTVSGTAGNPVVIRAYPGERAVIDGVNTTSDNFVVSGPYTVLWGLEFTNTAPSRSTSIINHSFRADLLVNNAPHTKYVNLIVHDGGGGFYNYSDHGDVEIYGGIWYNIGWQAPDRGHGHALYLKSDNGPLIARDNILFNQFGYGIHVYTNVGDGLLNNIRLEGNVSFNSGTLATTGTSANLGNLGEPPANNLVVVSNMTYMVPGLSGANMTLGSGSGLTSTDNFVVGGGGLTQGSWSGTVVTRNNTVLPAGPAVRPVSVFVRPNDYESGRATIVIYNWSGQGSVPVDLSNVLRSGDQYEVRGVQDLFGAAVASGTFAGGSVSIPMRGVTPPIPVGMPASPAPKTGPYFDVFVVTKR